MRKHFQISFLFGLILLACKDDESIPRPSIQSFIATPSTINKGEKAILSWVVDHADKISIDQSIGTVTGNEFEVSPTETTTYTLKVENKSGEATEAVTIIVNVKPAGSGIAARYKGDVNIEKDGDVIFVEMFEQTSINSMITASGYQTSKTLSNISFDASVPTGSLGKQSLKLTTVETSNASNDANEDSNILKRFSAGISDSVFVRYYVKYNSDFTFHHSGVWLGGTNPSLACWPCNIPGRTIPTSGDSAFVVGSEVRGLATQSATASSKFGLYNYWMDMKPYTTGPNANKYYGNEFLSPMAEASIDMRVWNCMEVMIKLNNPSTEKNGALKLWINGKLIAHYGKGFPVGTWAEAFFNEGTGTPFEGFRWRSNSSVVFNYIWLKNYSTNNTLGSPSPPNNVLYDHVVVAKNYIGPISQ